MKLYWGKGKKKKKMKISINEYSGYAIEIKWILSHRRMNTTVWEAAYEYKSRESNSFVNRVLIMRIEMENWKKLKDFKHEANIDWLWNKKLILILSFLRDCLTTLLNDASCAMQFFLKVSDSLKNFITILTFF